MNLLIVYYSRTGTTRKVAESISKALSCDIEEIIDTKNRMGPLAYVTSGRDALKEKLTVIEPLKKDPGVYDVIMIGTPIWAGTMSSPIRTYIMQNKERFKKVGFFCTGDSSLDKTLEAMKELCGKETVASVAIRGKEAKSKEYLRKIDEFVNMIKRT